MAELSKHKIVFILGPTAVGKSDFALKAAQKFSAAIVNSDSLQFFKSMDIGTAKPSLEERSLCPHFLFDIKEEGEEFTAGQFRDKAHEIIAARTQPLFFVGGSGFYVRALDKGMYPVKSVDSKLEWQVENELNEFGAEVLYKELCEKDPQHAKKINENDHYRLMRAICLMRSENKTMTEIHKEFEESLAQSELKEPKIKIGIREDRDILRERVRLRIQKMLGKGLIEEVKSLLDKGLKEWPPLKAVGYKEVVSHLEGNLSLQDMEEEIYKNTMGLAKRQMTWFKKDEEIVWFERSEGWDKPLLFLEEHL